MMRKIIKQGNGAYTITLPKKWVEENGLDTIKEIELEEKENSILLSTKNNISRPKKVQLKLDLYTKENYRSIIASLYRYGYDEIVISYDDKKIISILEKAINSLFGLELFFLEDNKCLIKSIYSSENTDIKMHVIRMVYTIKIMGETAQRDLLENDFKSKEEIYEMRNNILKQRDLILRIIKKQKLFDDKNFPYYTIALCLWNVARNYYHMYLNLDGKDMEYIDIFKKVNNYFNKSFKSLEKTSTETLLENHKNYENLFKEVTCNLTKSKMISFCLNIIIETQLAQSSTYILGKD